MELYNEDSMNLYDIMIWYKTKHKRVSFEIRTKMSLNLKSVASPRSTVQTGSYWHTGTIDHPNTSLYPALLFSMCADRQVWFFNMLHMFLSNTSNLLQSPWKLVFANLFSSDGVHCRLHLGLSYLPPLLSQVPSSHVIIVPKTDLLIKVCWVPGGAGCDHVLRHSWEDGCRTVAHVEVINTPSTILLIQSDVIFVTSSTWVKFHFVNVL